MEVLREAGLEREIWDMVPPSEHWRAFRYCQSLVGADYCRDDHFASAEFRMQSQVSPSRVAQLSQPRLESLLLRQAQAAAEQSGSELLFGTSLVALRGVPSSASGSSSSSTSTNTISSSSSSNGSSSSSSSSSGPVTARLRGPDGHEHEEEFDFVVGADGARSRVRQALGVAMLGEHDLEAFASVHFTSRALGARLAPENKGAMLSFVFNARAMGVVVSHDMRAGEWVLHLPFFPPVQKLEDLDVRQAVLDCLGVHEGELGDFKLHSTRAWGMHAVCAASFKRGPVMLVGDAAHQFPPSGGFGVNAGLVDAHNLAWKLALVARGEADAALLDSYDEERRPATEEALAVAVDNYRRGLLPARALGLDRGAMAAAVSLLGATGAASPSSSSGMRERMVHGLLRAGRQHLAAPAWLLAGPVRKVVEAREALPLLFPRTDKGQVYRGSSAVSYAAGDPNGGRPAPLRFWLRSPLARGGQADWAPELRAGALVPHAWVTTIGEDDRPARGDGDGDVGGDGASDEARGSSGAAPSPGGGHAAPRRSTLDLVAMNAPAYTLLCVGAGASRAA